MADTVKNADLRALTLHEVIARLLEPQPTCVLFHARPDGDAVGSAFALALWLRAMGSPAWCLCADEVPERLRFLTEGLQQSVLPEHMPAEFVDARAVSVDTASPAQLGRLYERFAGRIELMIDHHGKGTPYADAYICPEAAATGEVVYDLMAASGKEIPAGCAALLYAAISADTGCFRYSNVTRDTHLRAAALVESGIDAAEINRRLFEVKSMELLRAERAGFDRLSFYEDGKVAILTFPYELRSALELSDEHLETLVDVARCVEGVEVAVAIRQSTPEGVFRVSLRANVDFDVAEVAAEFGGGGHRRAAGTSVRAADIAAAERAVADAILARRGGKR